MSQAPQRRRTTATWPKLNSKPERSLPPSISLDALIAEYLGATTHSRESLRELRSALGHVSAALGTTDAAAVRAWQVEALVERLRAAGLSPRRATSVIDALDELYEYAIQRGLVRVSPLGQRRAARAESPLLHPLDRLVKHGERVLLWALGVLGVAFVAISFALLAEFH